MTAQPVETAHDAPLASPASTGVTRSGAARIDAIDKLRGLMIALMVLDHVRDFFHRTASPRIRWPWIQATRPCS